MSELPRRFRAQAEQCARHGSPLTAALLRGAADDDEAGGPTSGLLAPFAEESSGSVVSLRFAGALHRLVLERRAPELGLHYQSVGGTAAAEDVWPIARRVVAEQAEALAEGIRRPVQTNEVGRAAALYGGLLHVTKQTGMPIRLLEVGASAGLNLLADRFAYQLDDSVVLGEPSSPVRLRRPWQGRFPPYDVALEIRRRAGCDPQPLDPGSQADRLTLTSYVWGDQVERLERLRGALQIAASHFLGVEALPASVFLDRELAEAAPGAATVVWHSVVRQYLGAQERATVDRLLAEAGARATEDAPLFRLSLEPERRVQSTFRFLVQLTAWPGGEQRTLAECLGHGPPVLWA